MRFFKRISTRPAVPIASSASAAARSMMLPPGISTSAVTEMEVRRARVNAMSMVSANEMVWKTVRSSW